MKSNFFITTPVSATLSMQRIYRVLYGSKLKKYTPFDRLFPEERKMELLWKGYQPEGQFVYIHLNAVVKAEIDWSPHRIIINFRDPRDFLCNLYYWRFQHQLAERDPDKEREAEILAARKKQLEEQGIDNFALQEGTINYIKRDLNAFKPMLEQCRPGNLLVNSYALLCLEFDEFVGNACRFFECELDEEQRKSLEPERSENITKHEKWIGHKWAGSDTMPGRYKNELAPDTIRKLNETFREELNFLAAIDHPRVKHTYSYDDLPAKESTTE